MQLKNVIKQLKRGVMKCLRSKMVAGVLALLLP